MVLVCFWLILIVDPRPIFDYLMISYGFAQFSNGFSMFLTCFWSSALARSSVILWFALVSFGFLLFRFAMFLVNFNSQPSPDLILSYGFLWFCKVSICFCFVFRLICIVGPRLIFGYLMISYGFALFSFGFDTFLGSFYGRPSPDLRLSDDFPWFGMVSLWFWYVSGWF